MNLLQDNILYLYLAIILLPYTNADIGPMKNIPNMPHISFPCSNSGSSHLIDRILIEITNPIISPTKNKIKPITKNVMNTGSDKVLVQNHNTKNSIKMNSHTATKVVDTIPHTLHFFPIDK